jgi:DNA-binding CsgD family transcriptional regulator
VLKDISPEHLVAAVRMVWHADALLAPSITRRLIQRFAPAAQPAGRPPTGALTRDLSVLTPRELEVLAMVGRGLSNAEVAITLTLSEATVKTHVARILMKLDLRNRVQAVMLAYEAGLVRPDGDLRARARRGVIRNIRYFITILTTRRVSARLQGRKGRARPPRRRLPAPLVLGVQVVRLDTAVLCGARSRRSARLRPVVISPDSCGQIRLIWRARHAADGCARR